MDDYGNSIFADYYPTMVNPFPPAFNWSAMVYFLHPEYWFDTEETVYGRAH